MTKDGPSSSRIGFGFQQARKAGVPHRSERTTSQINLENLLKRRPGLSQLVATLEAEGKRANNILVIIRDVEGLDGRYSIECWRDDECENWAKTEYSDDREKLVEEIEFGVGQGIYKWACLYVFDYDTKEWSDGEWWPKAVE